MGWYSFVLKPYALEHLDKNFCSKMHYFNRFFRAKNMLIKYSCPNVDRESNSCPNADRDSHWCACKCIDRTFTMKHPVVSFISDYAFYDKYVSVVFYHPFNFFFYLFKNLHIYNIIYNLKWLITLLPALLEFRIRFKIE